MAVKQVNIAKAQIFGKCLINTIMLMALSALYLAKGHVNQVFSRFISTNGRLCSEILQLLAK